MGGPPPPFNGEGWRGKALGLGIQNLETFWKKGGGPLDWLPPPLEIEGGQLKENPHPDFTAPRGGVAPKALPRETI